MKVKRYVLFSYDDYYPAGGWGDFVGSFDTIEDARSCPTDYTNREIIDLETGEDVSA